MYSESSLNVCLVSSGSVSSGGFLYDLGCPQFLPDLSFAVNTDLLIPCIPGYNPTASTDGILGEIPTGPFTCGWLASPTACSKRRLD